MSKITSPNGRYETVLHDDGNLVTYRNGTPIWASGADPTPPTDPPPPTPTTRAGAVRLEGRAFRDDGGCFLPLGTSLFWLVRDPLQTGEANATWARDRGVDDLRVLAETTDWHDEVRTDPRLPDYGAKLDATFDLAHRVGVRLAWTLFGGNALTPSEQARCVNDVLSRAIARRALVRSFEVSNEGQGFGDPDGEARMRSFARLIAEAGFAVALTSADHAHEALYPGSAATVATEHFERQLAEGGWRPVRQPWGYWDRDAHPPTFINNEPVGIQSSVAADSDPKRLACAAVVTWLVGGCAHVVHTGAGIYGVPTTHPTAGARPANLWEQPTLDATLRAIAALRALLPSDLPNWTRQNHHWDGHPFSFSPFTPGDPSLAANHGCVRAFAAVRGAHFVCLPIGVMQDVTLTPKRPMRWATFDILTGRKTGEGTGALTLTTEALILGAF